MYLFWFLFFWILILFTDMIRRYAFLAWTVILVIPVLYFPFWLQHDKITYFFSLKFPLVLLGAVWFLMLRYTRLGNRKWPLVFLYSLTIINILAAVYHDYQSGYYLNTIAGVLLIFSFPNFNHIEIKGEYNKKELTWNIPFFWIFCYTLWNWSFCYSNWFLERKSMALILLVSIFFGIIKRKRWLEMRYYSLFLYMLTFYYDITFFRELHGPVSLNKELINFFQYTSLVCTFLYTIYFYVNVFKKFKKKELL